MWYVPVMRRAAFAWVVALALGGTAGSASDRATRASDASQEKPTLLELVEAYFRTEDPDERTSLARSIKEEANGDVKAVADALGHVQLWSPLVDKTGTFSFTSGDGTSIPIAYRLPEDYDPTRRHPLILFMPDDCLFLPDCVGPGSLWFEVFDGNWVYICPECPIEGTFHHALRHTGDLQRLMRLIRRRVHIDTDRVFLRGGEAAWMAAITHPDLFASVCLSSAYPRVPYPEQVYPFLLQNLRTLPVLTHWYGSEGQWRTGEESEPHIGAQLKELELVTAYNRAIVRIAQEASLPITGIEKPVNSSVFGPVSTGEIEVLRARRRAPAGQSVSHWFRYPAHGNVGWLRQTKFMGEVWEAEQLSILPSPTADRNKFIVDVIKDKMAYIGGKVEGQTVTIETRRCARIELLLTAGLVDFSQPITVRCNGRKRYDRVVHPSIRTMLEQAYGNWDFQRPVVARLSFGIKSDTKRR